jgi:pimeloyl-ACP methyl ester carboxylesterase
VIAAGAARRVTAALVTLVLLAGCSTIFAVKEQQRRADTNGMIAGTVTSEGPARGPLVVVLLKRGDADWVLADYFVRPSAGPWGFGIEPGTYWVAAFEDVNGDGAYHAEPFYRSDSERPVVLAPGQRIEHLDIVIPRAGRALRQGRVALADLAPRGAEEQQTRSLYALSAAGQVVDLGDHRFDDAAAEQGLWRFYDFLLAGRAGIYFLEPYDPQRIPVLFVHGIGGTPRNFARLIASLDRRRFQAWVLSYPSGARLDVIVPWVDQLLTRLELSLGVRRAVVVAHSMGGLVARGLVLQHEADDKLVRMLITISSPLGGMASAGAGVEDSPIVVRSWYGLAPGSPYLEGLYYDDPATRTKRRRLPQHVPWHVVFGFRGGGRAGSSDGVVTLASQLRLEAQEEARSVRGYDETHTSILESAAVAARLAEVLADLR